MWKAAASDSCCSVIPMTSISNSKAGRSGFRPNNESTTGSITGWLRLWP